MICRNLASVPLRQFRARAAGSAFATGVRTMLTGTAIGQAASLVLAPLLTRLYAPDAFGYLGIYGSALAILGMVGSLGYELAIPLARSEHELVSLVGVCTSVLTMMTGLIAVAALTLPDTAFAALHMTQLAAYRTLVPIGFASLGGYAILVAAATQLGEFRDIARTRVSQGLSGPLSQIGLGLFGAGAPGLAIGFVIGQSSGTLLLLRRVIERCPTLLALTAWRGVWTVAACYGRFPLVASWSRLIDMAGSGPILFPLLAVCYGSDIAGYLFLVERVIARPLLMVSTSVLQVFAGEAGRAVRQDPALLLRRFRQVVGWQLMISGAWVIAANAVAVLVFGPLFGDRWQAAVPLLPACGLMYLALSVMHPVSTALQLLQRHGTAAAWQCGRLLAVAGSVLVVHGIGGGALAALWATAMAQAVACVALLGLISFHIKRIP